MSDSRNILIVTHVVPYPPSWGFATRILNLSRQLAHRHRISLLCYQYPDEGENVLQLSDVFTVVHAILRPRQTARRQRMAQIASTIRPIPYQRVKVRSSQLARAVADLHAREHFDVIQVETAQMAWFDTPRGTPLVIDEHNLEYELFQRMADGERSPIRKAYYALESAKLRRLELRSWRQAAGCVFTSDREELMVRKQHLANATATVPNGVDVDFFRPDPDTTVDPHSLIFTGLMDYRPNTDAVLHFVKDVLPHVRRVYPAVRFSAVGQGVTPEIASLHSPHVSTTGWVKDVRPYFSRAACVVVPLRMGSGTRLKVLEAMAMGRPVVSTPLGCEGIDVRHGEHLLIASDPAEFAVHVLRLLDDPDFAARLGAQGRQLVESRYSWAVAANRLDDFHSLVIGNRQTQTA